MTTTPLRAFRPNLANIRKACYRSKQSYLTAEATPDPSDILISDVETDAQVVVSKTDDTTCIAFRGTTSAEDWKLNSRVWLVPSQLDPRGKVHAGFSLAWESIKKEVYAAIEKNGVDNLLITGHSLGSALAHVACTDIAKKYPAFDLEVITFGGPRPGNKQFGIKCREKCPKMIRVVFENDVVPNMPSMLFGYNHGDCECLHLFEDGTYSFKNKDTIWIVEFVRRMFLLVAGNAGVKHHHIDRYMDGLAIIDDDCEHFRA